jgi:hypothetical protein
LTTITAHASGVWFEGVYGHSSVPMDGLNEYRSKLLWNGTTPTAGKIQNPDYSGASLGARFLFHTMLSFRYENQVQRLVGTSIPATSYSVCDSVIYEPISINLDLPINIGSVMFTIGGGMGYALTYQYHQKLNGGTGEDVIWQAHPVSTRARISLGYRLIRSVALFGEVNYESVKSGLKAYKDYQTTASGSAIAMNQDLKNANGDKTVVDLSGLRYGVGLRLMF